MPLREITYSDISTGNVVLDKSFRDYLFCVMKQLKFIEAHRPGIIVDFGLDRFVSVMEKYKYG